MTSWSCWQAMLTLFPWLKLCAIQVTSSLVWDLKERLRTFNLQWTGGFFFQIKPKRSGKSLLLPNRLRAI